MQWKLYQMSVSLPSHCRPLGNQGMKSITISLLTICSFCVGVRLGNGISYPCDSESWKLEQLERLRSEDTPRRPVITHTIDH